MINKEMIQYDFNDLIIEPEVITSIKSRKEIDIRKNNMLPLMTAPMDTVINEFNLNIYENLGIIPILTRIKYVDEKYVSTENFLSYSLTQVEDIFLKKPQIIYSKPYKVLIDVANGHMKSLHDLAKKLKKTYGDNIELMVGNIANPITIDEFCKIKVDYVRIGIGGGSSCTSSANVAVGGSLAYLINETYKIRNKFHTQKTQIIADGGIKSYADAIKAIALGADYVMLGGVLNKSLESCAITKKENGEIIDQYSDEAKEMFLADIPLYKDFRGMSTKDVQISLGKQKLTTSEGIVTKNKVEYLLATWVENFEDYLKSAMSYTNKNNLHDFKGKVNLNIVSENYFKRYNK
jgi:hypothetical protein